jgi:hypothetical protein
MRTPYYQRPEYLSAVAHPWHVSLWADWTGDPVTVGFRDEQAARAFAASRPEPIVDLVARDRGVIACRRLLAHPLGPPGIPAYDDFPEARP